MGVTEVIGLQWGDEGKGKISNIKSANADVVIRANGGANAGHTVVKDGEKYALHLLPSSIINPNCVSVIAAGVVVDLEILYNEIESLRNRGVQISGHNLKISSRAHVVFPWHKELDQVYEDMRDNPIGTTKRGIGIAYSDKALRVGIRMGDIVSSDTNKIVDLIKASLKPKRALMGDDNTDFDKYRQKFNLYRKYYAEFVCDTEAIVQDAIRNKKNIVIEGAQATGLDIDFGTYPDVTSSSCTASGIAAAAGIGPRDIGDVIGVAKTYTSRVGEGPFPTEQINEIGDKIRELGHEYGTTTGRPRRTGWLDLVWLKYAVKLNSVNRVVFNHADTIGAFDRINLATSYLYDLYGDGEEKRIDFVPEALEKCNPVYLNMPGDWGGIKSLKITEDMTEDEKKKVERAKMFFEFIESYLNDGEKNIRKRKVRILALGWGPGANDIEFLI